MLSRKTDPKKKRNIKSPEMPPPKKDPIPNQDSTIIINQKDPILPPLLSKCPTVYKPFIGYAQFSKKK